MAIKISKNRLDMGSTPIKNVQYLDVDQVATPAAPATGKTRFYSKSDGSMYVVPAAGSETAVGGSIPANLIAHTTATTAPTGWTEFTAGRGRVIVGVPLSGTNAGTVGTALTNLQDPTHTHTGPSHQHDTTINIFNGYTDIFGLANAPYGTGSNIAAPKRFGSADGGDTHPAFLTATAGTGATSATSATMPYIQQLGIIKS